MASADKVGASQLLAAINKQTEIIQKIADQQQLLFDAQTRSFKEITVKLNEKKTTKSGGKGAASVTSKEAFPQNASSLLRKMWQDPEQREEIVGEFFTAENLAEKDKHMSKDAHAGKQGVAKSDEEVNFLISKFIRPHESRIKHLTDFYTKKKLEYDEAQKNTESEKVEKPKKTQAKKETTEDPDD